MHDRLTLIHWSLLPGLTLKNDLAPSTRPVQYSSITWSFQEKLRATFSNSRTPEINTAIGTSLILIGIRSTTSSSQSTLIEIAQKRETTDNGLLHPRMPWIARQGLKTLSQNGMKSSLALAEFASPLFSLPLHTPLLLHLLHLYLFLS